MWNRHIVFAVLVAITIATTLRAVWNTIDLPGSHPRSSNSRDLAKQKGVWLCDVSVEPAIFEWNKTTFQLGEAWIEKAYEGHFLAWFPIRSKWDRLCLRIPEVEQGFIGLHNAAYTDRWQVDHSRTSPYVIKVEAGEHPTLEYQVLLLPSGSDDKVRVGKVVLTPLVE